MFHLPLLIVAAFGIASCSSPSSSAVLLGGITSGQGEAVIRWTPGTASTSETENPPQPFSGTIDGRPVAGVSRVLIPPDAPVPQSVQNVPLQGLQGTFGGKQFDLSLTLAAKTGASGEVSEGFKVTGEYASTPVDVFVGAPEPAVDSVHAGRPTVRFSGTVGALKVSGTIATPHRQSATASFTVDG